MKKMWRNMWTLNMCKEKKWITNIFKKESGGEELQQQQKHMINERENTHKKY